MAPEGLLRGHTVLVTGASRGIGKAVSVGFAQQGADVILVARKRAGLKEAAEACRAAGGGSVEIHEMDGSSTESVNALAKAVEGKVSVLVNNAGMLAGFGTPPLEQDPEDWDAMLKVNVAAPMRLVRLLGPSMAKKGNAIVINISSVAGLDPMPANAGYGTSKWALTGFSESIAEALKGSIRVVTIYPAFVATSMTEGVGNLKPEQMIDTKDIMEAALLPFRMSSKACPTRIVVRNAVAPPS